MFFVGQVAQAADVEDQLPTVVGLLVVGLGPAWHAGERNAAANDVAELAVGEIVCLRQAEVRDSRIEIAADVGLAGAVRGVADGAAVEITFAGFFQNVRSGFPWVGFEAGFSRNSEVACGAGNDGFEAGRVGCGGEAAQDNAYTVEASDNNYCE